uniref:Uncharacterized protein n=1 Tax=Romanomermis culicivorax TaxID=13658 RepID=A0A915IU16_ROMCU
MVSFIFASSRFFESN